jgi:hypothetical protein
LKRIKGNNKYNKRYNKKQKSADEYQPGDIVLVEQEAAVGGNRKLQKLPSDIPEIQRTQNFYKGG